MRYQEYPPPGELASWIKLFWVFESRTNDPVPETVVADGCPELIVHFGSPFAELDGAGKLQRQPAVVACGQLTRPLLLHGSLDAGMIGIRFHPSGMSPFLSAPMQSLTDVRVPAESLFVDLDQFVDEVMDSSDDRERVAACNRFLTRSIDYERHNLKVQRALERIMLTRGSVSVESLATMIGTGRRSLELAFQKEVGISPKMYCRIARFRHLYDAVSNSGPSVNWIQIALDSGFFDQSHLIRDFRQFTGDSPTAFLANQTSFAPSANQN